MGRTSPGVRRGSESTIEIDFRYRGVRCRERIDLPPTPRNLAVAERLRGAILLEIASGTFDYATRFPDSPTARRLTSAPKQFVGVSEALDNWLARKTPELEHSSLVNYRRAVERTLKPAFGRHLLRELTRDHVADWIASQTTTAKRINNVLSPLRQMLEEALGAASPMAALKVKRRRAVDRPDEIDPFTPDELKLIVGAAAGQVRNLIQFAAWTGLRTSELIALQWADVDIDARTVRVRAAFTYGQRKSTKTAAGDRTVTLLAPAAAALRDQQEHTRLKGAAVFENPATLSAWTSDKQIREWNWRPILKRAGVRYRYPYQLRHTYASTMLSAGENLFWVSRQMGHTDPSMTARKYTRFIPSILPNAGKLAEALWA